MLKDLLMEIKHYIKGSTFDAILPGVIFVVLQRRMSLLLSVIIPIIIAVVLLIYRLKEKSKWFYSVAGFMGVVIAAGFAYVGNNSSSYFLPDIIGSATLALCCLISIIMRKPLAAWLSHLTRGWNRQWFWRKDILPAYMEATIFWLIFLIIRLIIMIQLYTDSNVEGLFIYNFILGFPMTLIILSITYILGILRLRQLGGPGVDEFEAGTPKPWRGQRKGF